MARKEASKVVPMAPIERSPTGTDMAGVADKRKVMGSAEVGSTSAVEIAAHKRQRLRGTKAPSAVAVLASF